MRASEALLLNSHMFPQCTNVLEKSDGSRCALGTIVGDIQNIDSIRNPYKVITQRYHIMVSYAPLPLPDCIPVDEVLVIIYTLNDIFRWTRPQIAEWLRKIEDEYGEIGPQLPTKEGEHAVYNDHVTVSSERL